MRLFFVKGKQGLFLGVRTTKISIIIPVYKVEKMLARCLDSLLAQTYTDWNAFLIDDASPDRSGEVAMQYVQKDPRIHYMRNEKNMGVSATRNRALALIQSEYVAFLDSDDWWEADALEKMMAAAEKYEADIVQCAWRINYPDGSEIIEENTFPDLRKFSRSEFAIPLKKMFTSISMNHVHRKLVRRELFRGLMFAEDLKTAEDLKMSFQLLMKARTIVFIPDTVYHYYRDGSGLTGKGLPFRKKWQNNRAVSTYMLSALKGTEFNTVPLRFLAWFRPYSIILDKIKRILRDRKAIKQQSV